MFGGFVRVNWHVLLVGALIAAVFVIAAHRYDSNATSKVAQANARVSSLSRRTAAALTVLEAQICAATSGSAKGGDAFRTFLYKLARRADERARIDLRTGPKTLAQADLDSARLYRNVARGTGTSHPIGCHSRPPVR
jgi:hypothetical protein